MEIKRAVKKEEMGGGAAGSYGGGAGGGYGGEALQPVPAMLLLSAMNHACV